MFRKIKYLLCGLFLLLLAIGVIKDKAFDTAQTCKNKQGVGAYIFGTSGTLVYRLYFWSLIPMGELRISTKLQDQDIIFAAEADSAKSFVDRFIVAKARVESHFSRKDNLPYKYVERTEVNGKIKEKEVLYDRKGLLALQGEKKTRIANDTLDPLGAFVKMLASSFEDGKDVIIPFMSGGDIYNFKITPLSANKGIQEVLHCCPN